MKNLYEWQRVTIGVLGLITFMLLSAYNGFINGLLAGILNMAILFGLSVLGNAIYKKFKK